MEVEQGNRFSKQQNQFEAYVTFEEHATKR